jgi:hypothetical protein
MSMIYSNTKFDIRSSVGLLVLAINWNVHGRCQEFRLYLDRRLYLVQTHFCKTEIVRNYSHQHAVVIWMQVKTLHKQQTLHILYKTVLKPMWSYRMQLLYMASTSNIEILKQSQLKALHMIVDTFLYHIQLSRGVCHYSIVIWYLVRLTCLFMD